MDILIVYVSRALVIVTSLLHVGKSFPWRVEEVSS